MTLPNVLATVRNGFCVAKSLLPKEHFLQQYVLNGPFNSVTRVGEYIIAPAQVGGVYYNVKGGYNDIISGLKDYKRYKASLAAIDRLSFSGNGPEGSAEYTVLRQGVIADRNAALTKLLVGFCKFNIGVGFTFLVINTLHLGGPTHPAPLFKALCVLLSSLLCILAVVLNGILSNFRTAKKLFATADGFRSAPRRLNAYQRLDIAVRSGFEDNMLEGLSHVNSAFTSFTPAYRSNQMSVVESVQQDLAALTALLTEEDRSTQADDDRTNAATADHLQKKAKLLTFNAALDAVFLALNTVAFYGYLLGVLAWFFPNKDLSTQLGRLLSIVTLKLTADQADFYGFLAGDAAWTVEPLLALASPWIVGYVTKLIDRAADEERKNR